MRVHQLPHHVDPRVMPPRFPVLLDHIHIAGNMFFQPCVQPLGRGCDQLIEQVLFIPAVAVNSRRRQAAALSDGAHGGLLKPIFEKLLPRGGHESDVIYGLIPWHKSAPSKLLADANYMLTQFAYLVKPCILAVLLQLLRQEFCLFSKKGLPQFPSVGTAEVLLSFYASPLPINSTLTSTSCAGMTNWYSNQSTLVPSTPSTDISRSPSVAS